MADFIIENWKKRILTFSIGLYFLPVFLIYPGIKKLSSFLPYIAHLNTYNLIFSHTIFGFTNAFILLLLIYGLSKNTFFEQLLLENNNRMKSFFQGIVLIKPLGIFIIPGITFASIWSEFFLSNQITTSQSIKPFSVILQTSKGQYETNYTIFAAGAILSLFAFLIFLIVIFILFKIVLKAMNLRGQH